jgi:hypothetical protein
MQIRELPDRSVLYVNARGAMQLHDLGSGIVLHVSTGIMDGEFVQYVIGDAEKQLAKHGRCMVMVDLYDAKTATSDFRDAVGAWFRAHRTECQAHLLIRSKLIEMAVNVTNLVLQAAFKVYSNPGEWEAVARRDLGIFRRRPLVLPADPATRAGGQQ